MDFVSVTIVVSRCIYKEFGNGYTFSGLLFLADLLKITITVMLSLEFPFKIISATLIVLLCIVKWVTWMHEWFPAASCLLGASNSFKQNSTFILVVLLCLGDL